MFQQLARRAKEGDIKAKEEIINRLQPLIISSIKRYYFNKNEFEDLMQEGNLQILESIELYVEEKGVYFLGYIKMRLKHMYLEKHKQRTHSSLNQKIGDGGVEIVDLLVSDDEDILVDMVLGEDIKDLRDKLKELTKRQREVVLLFYIEKMSIGEIRKKLGISYRTVVNTKTMALKKLNKIMQYNS